MSQVRSWEQYRKRRNRGLGSLGGGIGAMILGVAIMLGAIALDEFFGWSAGRRFSGHIGALFVIGGFVGIIAGIADVLWAWTDQRPRKDGTTGSDSSGFSVWIVIAAVIAIGALVLGIVYLTGWAPG